MIPGLLAPMPKLPARPYVPASAFAMWSTPQYPFPSTSGNWNGHSIRQLVAPLVGVGQQFRFTFDRGAQVDHAAFEVQSNGYNTLYGPAEITFGGGGHGFIGGQPVGGTTTVSDWITLPHFIDNTMSMIVIIDISAAGVGMQLLGQLSVAGTEAWGSRFAAASYNIASPPGVWTAYPGGLFGLTKVEAR